MMIGVLASAIKIAINTVKPELRVGISSFSTTSSTSHVVTLPSGIVNGDLIILAISFNNFSILQIPTGWLDFAASFGVTDSNSAGISASARVIGRIADGTEGSTIEITSSSSSTFGAVVIALKAGTFVMPRGTPVSMWNYNTLACCGFGVSKSIYSNTVIPHEPLYPPWGGRNSLYLSLLGRASSVNVPNYPYSEFQFGVSANLASVPDMRVSGVSMDEAPAIPEKPSDYIKNTYEAASTINLVIPGQGAYSPPFAKPMAIPMQILSPGTVSSVTMSASSTSTNAAKVGDLQLLVLMMYGAGSVTITPPDGFEFVARYGKRIAVYKKIVTEDGGYTYTTTLSSSVSLMAHLYAFPLGSYSDTAEVLFSGLAGTTGTSVNTPSINAGSSWGGLKNYAISMVVRDGVGDYLSSALLGFPADALEIRGHLFNSATTGGDVSYAIAGGVNDDDVTQQKTFVFGGAVSWESATIFIKGI